MLEARNDNKTEGLLSSDEIATIVMTIMLTGFESTG